MKVITPYETKELTLDLLKNTNINYHQNKKPRGKLVVELPFGPFREESNHFSSLSDGRCRSMACQNESDLHDSFVGGAGLLSVNVQGDTNVEGKQHSIPCVVTHFIVTVVAIR